MSPAPTPIPISDAAATAEVQVSGDIDIASLPELRDELHAALQGCPRQVILDLTRCRYTDAQALLVLRETARLLAGQAGELVLRGCSPETLRLLALAGVLDELTVEDSREVEVA